MCTASEFSYRCNYCGHTDTKITTCCSDLSTDGKYHCAGCDSVDLVGIEVEEDLSGECWVREHDEKKWLRVQVDKDGKIIEPLQYGGRMMIQIHPKEFRYEGFLIVVLSDTRYIRPEMIESASELKSCGLWILHMRSGENIAIELNEFLKYSHLWF